MINQAQAPTQKKQVRMMHPLEIMSQADRRDNAESVNYTKEKRDKNFRNVSTTNPFRLSDLALPTKVAAPDAQYHAQTLIYNLGCKTFTNLTAKVSFPILDGCKADFRKVGFAAEKTNTRAGVTAKPYRISANLLTDNLVFLDNSCVNEINASFVADLVGAVDEVYERQCLSARAPEDIDMKESFAGLLYGVEPSSVQDTAEILAMQVKNEKATKRAGKYVIHTDLMPFILTLKCGNSNAWQNGMLFGRPCYFTSNMDDNTIIFGNWESVVLTHFYGYDIIQNPFTYAIIDCKQYTINSWHDCVKQRPHALDFGVVTL